MAVEIRSEAGRTARMFPRGLEDERLRDAVERQPERARLVGGRLAVRVGDHLVLDARSVEHLGEGGGGHESLLSLRAHDRKSCAAARRPKRPSSGSYITSAN